MRQSRTSGPVVAAGEQLPAATQLLISLPTRPGPGQAFAEKPCSTAEPPCPAGPCSQPLDFSAWVQFASQEVFL